jgi:putative DNA primase/helicase
MDEQTDSTRTGVIASEHIGEPPCERIAEMANGILGRYRIITTRDKNEDMYVRDDDGVFKLADPVIKEQTKLYLGDDYRERHAVEVQGYIKPTTYRDVDSYKQPENLRLVDNGVLDMDTGELSGPADNQLWFNKLPEKYDLKADCPKIKKAISEWVNEEDAKILQEWFGFLLTPGYKFSKILLLVGGGRNGKTVLLNLMIAFCGERNVSHQPLQSINTNRFAKQALRFKLANTYDDLPEYAIKYFGEIKAMTGDGWISADRKNKDFWDFKVSAKLCFSCNIVPETWDQSDAFYERIIRIKFPNIFPDKGPNTNPNLLAELTTPEELSGLLNWALEGRKRLLAQGGFSLTKSLAERRQQYTEDSNTIQDYAEKCIKAKEGGMETKEHTYSDYVKFCKNTNRNAQSMRRFGDRFTQYAAAESGLQRVDGRPCRVWEGIEITNGGQSKLLDNMDTFRCNDCGASFQVPSDVVGPRHCPQCRSGNVVRES